VVAPDALVRLAYLQFSDRNYEAALQFARRAGDTAVESDTKYVAHFIMASCHEAQRRPADAVAEYAAALRAWPYGQSASTAVAVLLARDNQPDAAFDLVDRSVAEHPDGDDPWRLFSYGSYARWNTLIADVRRAIR
jgi:tetratricopeptide (TPR) repeat protein